MIETPSTPRETTMAHSMNSLLGPQSELDLRPDELVGEAYERIMREASSNSEQGRWFEHLFMTCVSDLPEFEITDIWPWRDWPDREAVTGRDGRDYGIDLVAELSSGERVAIQCKCYRPGHRVSKSDIDSFIAEARPRLVQPSMDNFDKRMDVRRRIVDQRPDTPGTSHRLPQLPRSHDQGIRHDSGTRTKTTSRRRDRCRLRRTEQRQSGPR